MHHWHLIETNTVLGDSCALICCLPAFWVCLLLVQLHKLEAALNWHLQYGALQDASVLQLLVVQAAADGNAAIMSLLLPLFDKRGWLVSKQLDHLVLCTLFSDMLHSVALLLVGMLFCLPAMHCASFYCYVEVLLTALVWRIVVLYSFTLDQSLHGPP